MPKPKLSVAEAQSLWADALAVIERLAEEFPCEACDGSGGGHESDAYPEPCPECWGRGFQIPEEW